jgi:hypothetical protein
MEAMSREYNSLLQNKSWELVDRPRNVNIIGSRWVFATKRNDAIVPARHKARFVAKGYSQQFGFDVCETWAPVTRLTSIRCDLSLTAMLDWEYDTAFLNAPVPEAIFMEQPEGICCTGGTEQTSSRINY